MFVLEDIATRFLIKNFRILSKFLVSMVSVDERVLQIKNYFWKLNTFLFQPLPYLNYNFNAMSKSVNAAFLPKITSMHLKYITNNQNYLFQAPQEKSNSNYKAYCRHSIVIIVFLMNSK